MAIFTVVKSNWVSSDSTTRHYDMFVLACSCWAKTQLVQYRQ